MLNETVARLLNEQVNKEFFSAYLYLDFANYYAQANLDGFQSWFMVQTQEERDHALLFLTYLQNNGEAVCLTEIAAPNTAFVSYDEPLRMSLSHEQSVTASIHNIYDAAMAVKDFRTLQFLDWFVKEQGEEEKNADDLVKKYALFGGDSKGLYMLNAEMGTRVYSPPSLVL